MKKWSLEDIILIGNLKYNNKFDYSKVEYVDRNTKMCIICPEHGEFLQSAKDHLSEAKVFACPVCAKIGKSAGFAEKGQESFLIKAFERFGDKYDYSKVNYTTNKNKIIITCPIHGDFEQTPNGHLKSEGCPKCTRESKKIHVPEKQVNLDLSINIVEEPKKAESGFVIGSVYLFQNIINGKLYVGKTIENYHQRFSKHMSCALEQKLNNYFYKAVRKHGWENFKKCIIFQTEILEKSDDNKKILDEIIREKEVYYISLFNTNNEDFGYNLTAGGDGLVGFKHSQESCEKMSKSRSGELHSNYGKRGRAGKFVKQFDLNGTFIKEYICIKVAGEENKIDPTSITNCCKNKNGKLYAGQYIWFYSSEFTEELLEEKLLKIKEGDIISKASSKGFTRSNHILQFNLSGDFIKEFISASEASKELMCSSSTISGAANGKFKSGKGYIWIYKKDFSPLLLEEKLKKYKYE